MAQAPVDRLPSVVDKDFPLPTDSERPQAPNVVSPTTLVLNYIRSQGKQPTSANVRAVLEEANRNPGLIPDLRTDRPATDAEDRAAMVDKASGTSRPLPIPPIPPNYGAGDVERPSGGDPQTSAQPAQPPATSSGPELDTISSLAPLVPALASAILGGRRPALPGQENLGQGPAMPPTGRVSDVNPPVVPAPGAPGLPAPQQTIAAPEAPNVPFSSPSPRVPPTAEELARMARLRPAGSIRPIAPLRGLRVP